MTIPTDLYVWAVTTVAAGLLAVVANLVLTVVNTLYVRRTLDEEVRLMRRMSEAITWLVDDARQDSSSEAQKTRRVIEMKSDEIKQEIQAARPVERGGRP